MKIFGRQEKNRKKVLAVASGGGHWIRLLRLQQAFSACDCTYVSVNKEYASAVSPSEFFYVPDALLTQTRPTLIGSIVNLDALDHLDP